jgi:hypothetical protein
MVCRFLLVTGCLLLAASAGFANVVYTVGVDTSALAGTHGGIDFNFVQGPLTPVDVAWVSILGFTTDGTLGTPATIGDVAGALPGAVTLNNTIGLNDYFSDFWFGSSMWFAVDFSGPAVESPSGFAASGSSFAFSMFSDEEGTIPALTSDSLNGYALVIDVNLDGTGTLTNYSSETTAGLVPEPGTLPLVGAVLVLLWIRWSRRARISPRAFTSYR